MTTDKRKYQRTKDENFLAYEFIDQDGNPILQGMGKTLNISKTGVLIEGYIFRKTAKLIKVVIEIGDELLELNGRITHVKKDQNGKCRLGIIFSRVNKAAIQKFEYYIDALSVFKKNINICRGLAAA